MGWWTVVVRGRMADPTGFEPAISSVTGWHVWPLHHGSVAARAESITQRGTPPGRAILDRHDPPIDLRSDTVTHPTPEMRRAMAEAELGDDVFGDDPTVNALEERAAEVTGKEAGLFVASGTMGNLVCLMAHVPRGGEIIAARRSHTIMDEAAGHAGRGRRLDAADPHARRRHHGPRGGPRRLPRSA